MKVFVIGLPESGRTTVAKSLCTNSQFVYVDANSWLKDSFRTPKPDEHPEHYHDAYHHWYLNRLKENQNVIIEHVQATIAAYESDNDWVIDGVSSPHDFPILFNPDEDFVVFLNRNDNQEIKIKDYENIGTSVIRDYCFWLASGGLLSRERWHEYNFRMQSTGAERFKATGSKNSVFIVGSVERVISHLKEALQNSSSNAG